MFYKEVKRLRKAEKANQVEVKHKDGRTSTEKNVLKCARDGRVL